MPDWSVEVNLRRSAIKLSDSGTSQMREGPWGGAGRSGRVFRGGKGNRRTGEEQASRITSSSDSPVTSTASLRWLHLG